MPRLTAFVAASVVAAGACAQTASAAPAATPVIASGVPNTPAAVPGPQHIKGTILIYMAPTLRVTIAKDVNVEITIPSDVRVIANRRITLKDIKPNDFVASAAVAGPDGKLHAQEVRVFPEAMRGLGEGQYPMDVPNRSMTNATVVEVAGSAKPKAKDTTLKLSFHGTIAGAGGACSGHASGPGKGTCVGQTEIVVGAKVPILRWELGDTSWLLPGNAVSLFAVTGADGKLSTHGVVVEHDGVKPLQ